MQSIGIKFQLTQITKTDFKKKKKKKTSGGSGQLSNDP